MRGAQNPEVETLIYLPRAGRGAQASDPDRDELQTAIAPAAQGTGRAGALARRPPDPALPVAAAAAVFDAVRRTALQRDLPAAGHVLRRAIGELTASERVYCLFHEPRDGALWSLDHATPPPHALGGGGLASFAARTGSGICAVRAADSSHYRAELDDPFGDGSERLITQPVIAAGTVIAVLVAVRRASAEPFSPLDRAVLTAVAEQVAPILAHFLLDHRRRTALAQASNAPAALFRREAIERHAAGGRQGEVLRLSPRWMHLTYGFLVAAVAAALLFASVVEVRRYSAGPAVVQLEGAEVTATGPGTVSAVRIASGAAVEAGDVLVELYAADEAAALAELDAEYENQLAAFLLDPADDAARTGLAATAARLERARSRLAERQIRAPRAGVASDVRVRAGMQLAPGDHVMTVVDEDATPTVLALLPGDHKSKLRVGMELRLTLAGHGRTTIAAVIDEVGGEVIGPREARRFLGAEIGDALPLDGPVVLVRARLAATDFVDGDTRHAFADGMLGGGEVEIGASRIISALLPGDDGGS